MLVEYLPVTKLESFMEKSWSIVTYQLFHQCMVLLLVPVKIVGKEGMEIMCANRWVCRVYTILIAQIANFLEQCLIACCLKSWCLQCLVLSNTCGLPAWSHPQDQKKTTEILRQHLESLKPTAFVSQGLQLVKLFWANLSHTNII